MKEMMIDEDKKKKDEKLLTVLCECFPQLNDGTFSDEILTVFIPCLLKVALKKEENEEIQKEVEIALSALTNSECFEIEQKLY
ncbi:uncharacterized protein MONOS_18291 [Monocercomonoides exilis]|uniref:uncharacterized protein n=1 Tax=Monocercomonoides exilis TaxID=2049356 RepID=UPI003559DDBD|nr:hypothetical protein MONOS_18291 [Monocercomonoides exilis]